MSLQTSSRLFALLGHLQARATATGPELAALLGVGERTVRKDVERLRELGYPVEAVRGAAGGYRFGDHGRLPPLLLEADEAVAVAVGLGSVSAVRGIEEAGALALAKLEHVAARSPVAPRARPEREHRRRSGRHRDQRRGTAGRRGAPGRPGDSDPRP